MKLSQFEKWFRAQYGKLPSENRPMRKIQEDMLSAERNLADLKSEYETAKDILEKFEAAKHTKNAAEKAFKF